MPSIAADAQASDALERVRARVAGNAARIAYFTIPSAVCSSPWATCWRRRAPDGAIHCERLAICLGHLAGSAVGLVAATTSRLFGVAHYALGDTKSPLRFTVARLALATGLGYVAAVWLPGWVGLEPRWGAAG